VSDFLFDANATVKALEALAELLVSERIEHQTLIVVGGSYLALTELRESTRDIDSVTRIEDATKRATERIGRERGYAPNWLNDAAAAFRPSGLAIENCTVLFDHAAPTPRSWKL
jgi:tRNA A37 N6-isopentenylltransferase MiaA